MVIKGMPGYFEDIVTYEFEPTGTHANIYTGADVIDLPAYRCTGEGTYINWYKFFYVQHPELRDVNIPDPIEVLSGIYLVRSTEYESKLEVWLSFTTDVYNSINGSQYTIAEPSIKFIFDKSILATPFWNMTFAHVSKVYTYEYVEGVKVWDYYPVAGDGLWFIQTIACAVQGITNNYFNKILYINEGTVPMDAEPVGIFQNIHVSTDSSTTWYYIGDPSSPRPTTASYSPQYTLTNWRKMHFESNQEDDTSGSGGGGGNYGYEQSDTNHYDGIPTVTPASSGFINVYHASIQNLLDMAKFMYSDNFLENVPKLVTNPIDYIISLMLFAASPDDGTAEALRVGSLKNVAIQIAPVQSVYKTFDCGSINIEECYGGFLDYVPYTRVRLQLPFCGDIDLDPQIVMHSTVQLRYAVDFLTGSCLARVDVTNNHGIAAETYFKDGNCAVSVPMTGADFNSYYASVFSAGFSVVSAGATTLATGNPLAFMGAVGGANTQRPHANTTVSGHLGSNHGFLGNYTPALIISRPVQSFPEGYNPNKGRPSNIGGTLGSFSGYTSVTSIKLDGVVATDAELAEIRQLLAGGVYV